jgi:hypothetical protein
MKLASDEEFIRISSHPDNEIDREQFTSFVMQYWGVGRSHARAIFEAGNPLGTANRLNRHEFLLLREAFHHASPMKHPAVAQARLRAIFHFYCHYDSRGNGVLSSKELLNWVQDMCMNDLHVLMVAKKLLPRHRDGQCSTP